MSAATTLYFSLKIWRNCIIQPVNAEAQLQDSALTLAGLTDLLGLVGWCILVLKIWAVWKSRKSWSIRHLMAITLRNGQALMISAYETWICSDHHQTGVGLAVVLLVRHYSTNTRWTTGMWNRGTPIKLLVPHRSASCIPLGCHLSKTGNLWGDRGKQNVNWG